MAATPPLPRRGNLSRPPRITINNIPGYASSIPTSQIPYTAQTIGGQPVWPTDGNPFNMMYSAKAGEFMNKQFTGFRDFTMSTAKSGMSFGEKSTFWLYEKLSTWSKKWFTHIFLCIVVLLYSVVGALIFQAVEGTNDIPLLRSVTLREDNNNYTEALRNFAEANQELMKKDPVKWDKEALAILIQYKDSFQVWFKPNDTIDDEPTNPWTFRNALFYCGTIYTTIGPPHAQLLANYRKEINEYSIALRNFAMEDNEMLKTDPLKWEGKALATLKNHKGVLEAIIKGKENWTFLNALFYCGTIYTTIGELM